MKRGIKKIWDEFIYGGHMTALGAPSIAFATALIANLRIEFSFLIIMYSSAELIYLYDRYKSIKEDEKTNIKRSKHLEKKAKSTKFFIYALSIITICLIMLSGSLTFKILFLALTATGLLYGRYLKRIMRKAPGFKNIIVVLLWSSIPIIFHIYHGYALKPLVYILFLFLIFREVLNTAFCDIKDITTDRKHGLKTIPNTLGKNKTLRYLKAINLASIAPLIAGLAYYKMPISGLFLALSAVYAYYYLNKAVRTEEGSSSMLFSYVPDFEPILYLFFVIAGELYAGF